MGTWLAGSYRPAEIARPLRRALAQNGFPVRSNGRQPQRISYGSRGSRRGRRTSSHRLLSRRAFGTWALHSLHARHRSDEHSSELQSLMRISSAVFCLKTKITLYSPLSSHSSLYFLFFSFTIFSF